jgi:hypothetical protein
VDRLSGPLDVAIPLTNRPAHHPHLRGPTCEHQGKGADLRIALIWRARITIWLDQAEDVVYTAFEAFTLLVLAGLYELLTEEIKQLLDLLAA